MSAVLKAIWRHALEQPAKVALMDEYGDLSYRELRSEIEIVAQQITGIVENASAVGVKLENSRAWAVVDLALVQMQIASLPLPPFFTPAQQDHALKTAGAEFLLSDEDEAGCEALFSFEVAGTFLHLYRTPHIKQPVHCGTAKITFTSGTTGTPKGVCLSQNALEATAMSILDRVGEGMALTHLAILPLSVLLENVAGLYPVLLAGGTYAAYRQEHIGFGRSFQPDFMRLVQVLEEEKITSAIMVPEILRGSMAALATRQKPLSSMRMIAVGGSRVAPGLLAQAHSMGLPVYEGYGLSEAGSVVAMNAPGDNVPGTVGSLLPHIEATILERGELVLMKPPFLGYVGQTAQVGPYRTGDIVQRDEEGRLQIAGRFRNVLINSYGRNIAPEWVESELLANPEIAQAVVFGDGRPALGAIVVPSSAKVRPEQLQGAINRANARLPEYAQVKCWFPSQPFTIASGELTGSGRPRRDIIQKARIEMIEKTYAKESDTSPFFDRLLAETEQERNAFMTIPLIERGLREGASVETYIAYLTEAYHHVKHTVPLMEAAKANIPADRDELHEALDEYIEEEVGHEEWILNDIRHAGGNDTAVRNGQPRLATELMVSFAYDYITRINPVGFFGMVLVLEGTSTAIATQAAEKLMETLGLSKNCFSYLFSHGALDIEHMKFFETLMNKISDPTDQEAIIYMAKRMYALFGNVLRSIPFTEEMQNVA